jgi:hypothetical protein
VDDEEKLEKGDAGNEDVGCEMDDMDIGDWHNWLYTASASFTVCVAENCRCRVEVDGNAKTDEEDKDDDDEVDDDDVAKVEAGGENGRGGVNVNKEEQGLDENICDPD